MNNYLFSVLLIPNILKNHCYIYSLIVKTSNGDYMIEHVEIKKQDDKEILYVYLNIEFEFGSIFNKNINIKKKINDFLKKNKINFKGNIATIFIGGVLIGNIILNKPNFNYSDINKTIPISEVIQLPNLIKKENDEVKLDNVNDFEDKNIDIIDSNNNLDEKNNQSTIKKDLTTNNNSNNQNNIDNKSNITTESSINQNTYTNTIESNIMSSYENEEVIDNNIYITLKRSNGSIISIELEEYVIGVVGAEMPALFHNDALKAQAIIARTYALKANSNGKILTDTESSQNYKDNNELKNIWQDNYNIYYNKIKSCVEETKGMYLTYNGNYIEAVYHSTSNGKTESSSNVWGNYFPYLVSVESNYDSLNPTFISTKTLSYSETSSKLGIEIDYNTDFIILGKTDGERVSYIQIKDKIFKGVEFRSLLGLKSADFSIEKYEDNLVITTKGYGHGVGLSQYGANGMAKNGYSYKDILKHYYQGVTINMK